MPQTSRRVAGRERSHRAARPFTPRSEPNPHAEQYPSIRYRAPTLPMFVVFPFLLVRLGFWPALVLSALVALCCYGLFPRTLEPFNVRLW